MIGLFLLSNDTVCTFAMAMRWADRVPRANENDDGAVCRFSSRVPRANENDDGAVCRFSSRVPKMTRQSSAQPRSEIQAQRTVRLAGNEYECKTQLYPGVV